VSSSRRVVPPELPQALLLPRAPPGPGAPRESPRAVASCASCASCQGAGGGLQGPGLGEGGQHALGC